MQATVAQRIKNARRSVAAGGNTHIAPAAIAAELNRYKAQYACSDAS